MPAPDEGVLLGVLLPEALHLALQVGDNKAELPASRPRRALHSKRLKAVRRVWKRDSAILRKQAKCLGKVEVFAVFDHRQQKKTRNWKNIVRSSLLRYPNYLACISAAL